MNLDKIYKGLTDSFLVITMLIISLTKTTLNGIIHFSYVVILQIRKEILC